jgi:hypothetical protein
MNPNYWGPAGWHFMHAVTLTYPEVPSDQDKEKYKIFFESVGTVLPCPACRRHYQENLKRFPIRLESRAEIFKWLIDIHNEVNKKKKKKVLSYDEAFEAIKENGMRMANESNSKGGSSNIERYLIIILGAVLMYMLYDKFCKRR